MISVSNMIGRAIDFYQLLILAYVVLSWLPASGTVWEIRKTLGIVVEPYVGLFRRIIPPIGMMDITPIVAILVLSWLIRPLLVGVLRSMGL